MNFPTICTRFFHKTHQNSFYKNIKNYEKNEYTIKVSLAYRSATLVENINISPGDSVGYVYSQESEKLKKGYYMCVLKYELLDTVVPLVKEYEVLVVVE